MTEDGELAVELVIDTSNLVLHVGGVAAAAREGWLPAVIRSIGLLEDSRSQQCLGIGVEHAGWDFVAWECRTLNYTRRGDSSRAVLEQHGRTDQCRTRNLDDGAATGEITGVGRRIWNHNCAVVIPRDYLAPFHVVEEESRVALAPRDLAAGVEAVDVEP